MNTRTLSLRNSGILVALRTMAPRTSSLSESALVMWMLACQAGVLAAPTEPPTTIAIGMGHIAAVTFSPDDTKVAFAINKTWVNKPPQIPVSFTVQLYDIATGALQKIDLNVPKARKKPYVPDAILKSFYFNRMEYTPNGEQLLLVGNGNYPELGEAFIMLCDAQARRRARKHIKIPEDEFGIAAPAYMVRGESDAQTKKAPKQPPVAAGIGGGGGIRRLNLSNTAFLTSDGRYIVSCWAGDTVYIRELNGKRLRSFPIVASEADIKRILQNPPPDDAFTDWSGRIPEIVKNSRVGRFQELMDQKAVQAGGRRMPQDTRETVYYVDRFRRAHRLCPIHGSDIPDGFLVTAHGSGLIQLWNSQGQVVKQLDGLLGMPNFKWDVKAHPPSGSNLGSTLIEAVEFSSDGVVLAVHHADNSLSLWMSPWDKPFHIISVAPWFRFSPDGRYIAVGEAPSWDSLLVLDSRTGKERMKLPISGGKTNNLPAIAFDHAGKRLAVGIPDDVGEKSSLTIIDLPAPSDE